MGVVIPVEILEKFKEYCKKQNLGMGSAWGDDYGIIIVGPKTSSPDVIALSAAQSLIEGVLNNAWNDSNAAQSGEREVQIINEAPSRTQ